ncbi:hypothetical protein MTO96_045910 [Rhipicephalus appendiculatus]
MDEWWLNTAYLDVRTPLPVHSSPAAIFPRQTFTSEEDFLLLVRMRAFLTLFAIGHDLRLMSTTAGFQDISMRQTD